MPFALAPWIWSLFTGLVAYFAELLGKRFSIVAAAITAFSGIIITFKLAIEAILSGLLSVTPTGTLLFGLQLLPDNTGNCIAAMAAGNIAAQVYVYWRNIIAFRLSN